MKRSLCCLFCLFFLVPASGFAQSLIDTTKDSTPLSDSAFARMMKRMYSYTIQGSEAPTSGFKIQFAEPAATLTGTIISNDYLIITGELTGGSKNNLSEVFSGHKLSGYFKTAIGVNLLKRSFSGSYKLKNPDLFAPTKYLIKQNYRLIGLKGDTLKALKKVFSAAYSKQTAPDTLWCYVGKYLSLPVDSLNEIKIEGNKRDSLNWFTGALNDSNRIKTIDLEAMLADYKRLDEEVMPDVAKDYEIDLFRDIWARRKIWWFNISPFISNSAFSMYNVMKGQLGDTTSLSYGITLSVNLFVKKKGSARFRYWKGGVEFKRVNNLDELQKSEFREAPVGKDANGTEELKNSSPVSAYKGALVHGFGWAVFGEGYWAWAKTSFVPGIYVKPQFSHSDTWLNTSRLSLDLGLLWNVKNSGDEDSKNLLSIVPYVSWSNFLTDYKDATKAERNTLSDLFSINIKFGIPINIGK
ncbi:hypothetical protein [Chitinophaga qingshengii]|uniref:Uncharacterized protein n=1 Tax=Chitinophaga qingshengii TaxID=1569794 RepID=A0ABR7TQI7_9BACT|nr:hypothetical protein [Chitinophaga qingshengii]MBC9932738.1 hypothetical protein [Chitinophaga qingshengii]